MSEVKEEKPVVLCGYCNMPVDPNKYSEHFPRNCPAIMGQYPAGYDFVANGYDAHINVWNCQATLYLSIGQGPEKVSISEDDIAFSEKDRERLKKLVMDSIKSSGGAINWSGRYAISPRLQRFIMSKRFQTKIQHAFEVATEKAKVQKLVREVEKAREQRQRYNGIIRSILSLLDRDTAIYTVRKLVELKSVTPEEGETLKQIAQYLPIANEETRQICEAMAFGCSARFGSLGFLSDEEKAKVTEEFNKMKALVEKYPHLIQWEQKGELMPNEPSPSNWRVKLTPEGERYRTTGIQMKCAKEGNSTYIF